MEAILECTLQTAVAALPKGSQDQGIGCVESRNVRINPLALREGLLRHRCSMLAGSLRSQANGSLGTIRVSCRQAPADGPEVPPGLCINQGGEVLRCVRLANCHALEWA